MIHIDESMIHQQTILTERSPYYRKKTSISHLEMFNQF